MSENTGLNLETCPLDKVNTTDPIFLQDPYPFYARMRREAPVFRDPKTNIVYVATYDLIRQATAKPLIFSNKFGVQLRSGAATEQDPKEAAIDAKGWITKDTMLTADPPEHTRYRKLAMKAFSYKRVLQMSAYVVDLVNDLIDKLPQSGKIEFKSQFANKLPMFVIADALGVPRSDFDKFELWSNAFVMRLGGMASPEERLDAAEKILEFQKYFVNVIEEKRANPTDDVISDLVHADLSKKNDLLLLRFGSGNRDEAVFSNPEAFDMTRENANKHLAFGSGIHTCLGAQLARKELQTAFPILLKRLKNIRLDPENNDLFYLPTILLRGVMALNIEYEKA